MDMLALLRENPVVNGIHLPTQHPLPSTRLSLLPARLSVPPPNLYQSLHATSAPSLPLHHHPHHATPPPALRSPAQSRQSKPRNRSYCRGSRDRVVYIFPDGVDEEDGRVGNADGVWIGVLGVLGGGSGGFAAGRGEDGVEVLEGEVGGGCLLGEYLKAKREQEMRK
ncbi:hypothetical protein QC760_010031 [Botrytis cinerea]